jgi:hypothetical protein
VDLRRSHAPFHARVDIDPKNPQIA